MIRELSFLAYCLLLLAGVVRAQDGLNLLTELYVLDFSGAPEPARPGRSSASKDAESLQSSAGSR